MSPLQWFQRAWLKLFLGLGFRTTQMRPIQIVELEPVSFVIKTWVGVSIINKTKWPHPFKIYLTTLSMKLLLVRSFYLLSLKLFNANLGWFNAQSGYQIQILLNFLILISYSHRSSKNILIFENSTRSYQWS